MHDWNPDLYRRFEDERTRPAAELLARVPLAQARLAVDLGCGPGNSTELLVQRFEGAEVVGMDNSPAMLQAAAGRLPTVRFVEGDVGSWAPPASPDLMFANAVLQWLPDHESLLPRLMGQLAPGGVLAVQMPDNLDEPSHRLMREVAGEAPYAQHLGDATALRARILPAEAYYDLLAALSDEVDVWRTTYNHRMGKPADIVQWLRSTGLKPFVEGLPQALQPGFLSEYERRIAAAYPERSDGRRLLAFPRLFMVARKKS
jgi:trans-aconitate 2-methyltransferase